MSYEKKKLFLVRDESRRQGAFKYTTEDFTDEQKNYCWDESDEFGETLGEWLGHCELGDEYENTEDRYTVIRIN